MQDWNNVSDKIIPIGDEVNEVDPQFVGKTHEFQGMISDSFADSEQSETLWNDWEYLKLYERQNETKKQLEERAEKNNIKDRDWYKLSFHPECLSFDDDMIIYNTWMPSNQPHLFKKRDWIFEEIPLLPEKVCPIDMQWNWIIPRNIRKVKDGIYCVELVHLKNKWVEQRWGKWDIYLWDYSESYYIDKTWKVLEQIWKLWDFVTNDGIYSKHNWENLWWFRQTDVKKYNHDWKLQSKEWIIFDKNFEKLFTIENSHRYAMQYCDDQACICQDIRTYDPKKYVIIGKTWIIAQWTEEDLKSNESMQKFLEREEERQKKQKENEDKKREKRRLPFGERFKEINHCIISLKDKPKIMWLFPQQVKSATIQNDQWKILYEIPEVLAFYEDDNRPEFNTNDWNLRISEWNKDSGVLCIYKYVWGYVRESIFINKTTWEKLEFDWYKWENASLQWRLIDVPVNSSDSEIYDENLNKLWFRFWSWSWLYAIARQEAWELKCYLYSISTWKPLCEIWDKWFTSTVKRTYRDKEDNTHVIVEKKDWTLIEVVPFKK